MYSSRFSKQTLHLAFAPSITLSILGAIIDIIAAVFVQAAHAGSESPAAVLDTNGGSENPSESVPYTVSIGSNVIPHVFESNVSDGKIFAGWSQTTGCSNRIHGVKYGNGAVFTAISVTAHAAGAAIILYPTRIPRSASPAGGELYVQSIPPTVEDAVADFRPLRDPTECSFPGQVRSVSETYHISVCGGVCAVTSPEMFSGVGNPWTVISVFYPIGTEVGPSGGNEVLAKWVSVPASVPGVTSV